ncbi:MAG: hypothetical protein HUU57_04970 [Bdellovibrio sp.]|nr:hypothetical protein [Bdellovibrio sp.]
MKLKETCEEKVSDVSKRYDAVAIHNSTNKSFTIEMRTACLQTLLNENIISRTENLIANGISARESMLPLQIQILLNGPKLDIFSVDIRRLESDINSLVLDLWLSSLLIKELSAILSSKLFQQISFSLSRLKSTSYLGTLYSFNRKDLIENVPNTKSLGDSLYRFNIDDAVLAKISAEKTAELACILNPTNDYCPHKIIYASDFSSTFEKYILIQKYLREPAVYNYSSVESTKSISNEFLCQQISLLIKEAKVNASTLECGASAAENGKAITSFLDKQKSEGQLAKIAFLFNSDRLRKAFPWSQKNQALAYAISIYSKDINYLLKKLKKSEANNLEPPQGIRENLLSEINELLSKDER